VGGLNVAPPPSGSRIQELHDRLIVRFRPRRSWGELVFLTFWLAFWTFGGIAALTALRRAGWGDGAFLFVWLCGWTFGECAAIAAIAWQLLGRELLTVTAQYLEVRKEISRFARVKRYDAGLVRDVTAVRVPTDEDERPRTDFCLKLAYDAQTVHVGEGMGEREAEYVASVVLSRIRPPARWSDEGRVDPYQPTDRQVLHAVDVGITPAVVRASPEPRQAAAPRRRWVAVFVVAVVAAGLVVCGATVALGKIEEHAWQIATTAASEHPPHVPPSVDEFSYPREYASAMTRFSLASGETQVLGEPDCGKHVTWTSWTCSVKARATTGSVAGRILAYRCFEVSGETRTIKCGPDPRSIAAARVALTSAG
jgi:hypothetical protein